MHFRNSFIYSIKYSSGILDIPARSEVILEGYIEPRVREIEGPFGEFPGSYSGSRLQPIVKITKITHRKNPIFENLYLGMPWTEIDYLMALNTSIPLYDQIKRDFPEVEAVNAMYTHGIAAIVSTKSRFGGLWKGCCHETSFYTSWNVIYKSRYYCR